MVTIKQFSESLMHLLIECSCELAKCFYLCFIGGAVGEIEIAP